LRVDLVGVGFVLRRGLVLGIVVLVIGTSRPFSLARSRGGRWWWRNWPWSNRRREHSRKLPLLRRII
jgi:hypothetical protein